MFHPLTYITYPHQEISRHTKLSSLNRSLESWLLQKGWSSSSSVIVILVLPKLYVSIAMYDRVWPYYNLWYAACHTLIFHRCKSHCIYSQHPKRQCFVQPSSGRRNVSWRFHRFWAFRVAQHPFLQTQRGCEQLSDGNLLIPVPQKAKNPKGTWDGILMWKQTTLKPWWLYPDARNTSGSGYFRPFLVNLWERHLAKLRIKWYHPCVLDAFQCARSCKDRPANRLDAIAALRTISSPAPGDKLYPGLDDTTLWDRDLCRVRTCTSNNKNISKANVAVSRQFSNQWIIRIQHDSTHSN